METTIFWPTVAILITATGVVIYFAFFADISDNSSENIFPGDSSEKEKAREKERRRIVEEKFDSIERSKILGMTLEEIASATGSTIRSVAAKIRREKIKCKDYDGSISDEELEKKMVIETKIGILVPQIICPHCQTRGQVHRKIGVERYERTTDTTNLTAAILSGTKTTVKKVTQLHCTNCETAWDI